MTNIVLISNLKNYTEVLSHCDDGSAVYLTKNGRGKFVVQTMPENRSYVIDRSEAYGKESEENRQG